MFDKTIGKIESMVRKEMKEQTIPSNMEETATPLIDTDTSASSASEESEDDAL